MPACKLLRFSPVPPGGFRIQELVHGSVVSIREFSMEQAASILLALRQNNGLSRATYDECVEDINLSTCQAFGCDPRWCGEQGKVAVAQPAPRKGCGTCGKRKR